MDTIHSKPWDACLTMGKNWSYNKFDTIYKTPEIIIIIIRNFVDIVSKGGNVLLNVGPTTKGVFPEKSTPILLALKNWLKINEEAIYKTSPWKIHGENFTEIPKIEKTAKFSDLVHDETPKDKTPDLRFTAKKNTVYVFARSLIENNLSVKSISKKDPIKSVKLLGNNGTVEWKMGENGLNIKMPLLSNSEVAVYVLKIEFAK